MKNLVIPLLVFFIGCKATQPKFEESFLDKEKNRVLGMAKEYAEIQPITISTSICKRSAGNKNDFYSEGDYWWPDPDNPDGPYIRKDGMTNPDNFTAHRKAMIRFSQIAGALGSAYMITKEKKYVDALLPHLNAWFLDRETMMNPNLLYGQAIMGRVTGRGIGIIDTIHLLEVAKAIMAIQDSRYIPHEDLKRIKDWFSEYLNWMTTHPFGIAERDNGNNHSVCWALQVAVFSELVGNTEQSKFVRNMYKNELLPQQMAQDGSFPLELKRTKPYGYSLFNLDVMTALCQVLSTKNDNIFSYTTENGRGIKKGMSFLYPYVKDKKKWPNAKDIMYWDEWPVRHPFLIFGGLAFENQAYIKLWNTLEADFDNPEVIRNMPVRYPMLWLH